MELAGRETTLILNSRGLGFTHMAMTLLLPSLRALGWSGTSLRTFWNMFGWKEHLKRFVALFFVIDGPRR